MSENVYLQDLPASFLDSYAIRSEVIGQGSYGQVFRAMDRRRLHDVAVKIINLTELTPKVLAGLKREVRILKKLRHPNVVKFVDSYESKTRMVVVMELLANGDLYHKLFNFGKDWFTENDIKDIIRKLAVALDYCHSKGVVHRDIKPGNILVADDGEIKLADFNLSMDLEPEKVNFSIMETSCGTANYAAPEIVRREVYNAKCDVWSVGVLAFVLLSGGYYPFVEDETIASARERSSDFQRRVRTGKWTFKPENEWSKISDDAKDFVANVMHGDVKRRFTFKQALKHRWLYGEGSSAANNVLEKQIDFRAFKNSHYKLLMLTGATMLRTVNIFKQILNTTDDDREKEVEAQGSGERLFDVL